MHHCAEGWLSVPLIVAIALQNHQFFWFASTGVQVFRLFRRHEAVVVRGDEQNGTGGNLVHHPFWIEAEGIVDVLEGNGIHGCRIMAPSGSGELRRLPVRQQDLTALNKGRLACQSPLAAVCSRAREEIIPLVRASHAAHPARPMPDADDTDDASDTWINGSDPDYRGPA